MMTEISVGAHTHIYAPSHFHVHRAWARIVIVACCATAFLCGCPGTGSDGGDGGAGDVQADGGTDGFDAGLPDSGTIDPFPQVVILDGALDGDAYVVVEDGEVLKGNRVALTATGLEPGARYRFHVTSNGYFSNATVVASPSGTIDLRGDSSEAGTYTGVDEDGFWWSMDFDWDAYDETKGFDELHIELFDEAESLQATADLVWLESLPGIVQEEVALPMVVAELFRPEGPGPFPAVIVFGGSEGGIDTGVSRARELASRGFLAIGAAYFAEPGLPSNLIRVPVEYMADIIDWVLARDDVSGEKVGIWGGSRGGEYALLLAAKLPQIGATVADVPSGVAWPAPTFQGDVSSWTSAGLDVPFVADHGGEPVITPGGDGTDYYSYRSEFETDMAGAALPEIEAATFDVEEAAGAILMLSGKDDQIWPSCDLANLAWDRLEQSGHTLLHNDENVCYPNAGHGLLRPGTPTTFADATWHSGLNAWLLTGGTPEGTASASRNHHSRVFTFLQLELQPEL